MEIAGLVFYETLSKTKRSIVLVFHFFNLETQELEIF